MTSLAEPEVGLDQSHQPKAAETELESKCHEHLRCKFRCRVRILAFLLLSGPAVPYSIRISIVIELFHR